MLGFRVNCPMSCAIPCPTRSRFVSASENSILDEPMASLFHTTPGPILVPAGVCPLWGLVVFLYAQVLGPTGQVG